MANLYYSEALSAEDFRAGEVVRITGEEAHHAVRVARLRVGERILIGNGFGELAHGTVLTIDRNEFSVELSEIRTDPHPIRPIVLVQALAKGDRDERAIEQVTEFGIDQIMPWQAARSVSRWDGADKAFKGRAKWQRIAREASKQSLRSRIPMVLDAASTTDLCALAAAGSNVLVLHPGADRTLSEYARAVLVPRMALPLAEGEGVEVSDAGPVAGAYIVVGPEGGLSDSELSDLAAAGAVTLRLGDTVLRTSSAGPAALAILNTSFGRW